tara:strand:+ start:147 stop:1202 length:1056 start_codon:yes stop_codon:yes gene_type:complete
LKNKIFNLKKKFQEFCELNKFEKNYKQIELIVLLEKFLKQKTKSLFLLKRKNLKNCFYLHGKVGVGKTMILNFAYENTKMKKMKIHFNEFMIKFHDFKHKKKNEKIVFQFVKELKKKYDLLYLDEFQVTNIVDAMILGKLFEGIFLEKIKVMISSNTKPSDLYLDGLQREQFIPFIKIIEKNSIQKELILLDDYRTQNQDINQKIYYPINEKTSFNINQNFRILTKNLNKEEKSINTKGRIFKIKNYYEGIARFNFKELCDDNLGAEDYLNLAKICNYIFIEDIPNFNEYNSNQQLRFITLIDILYDKKISLTLSMNSELKKISSSKKHLEIFKRTVSRLYEMTRSKNTSI